MLAPARQRHQQLQQRRQRQLSSSSSSLSSSSRIVRLSFVGVTSWVVFFAFFFSVATITTRYDNGGSVVVAAAVAVADEAASTSSSTTTGSGVEAPTCANDANGGSCDSDDDDDDDSDEPDRVVIIGGGPAGMGFCHALEIKRRRLLERGDFDAVSKLPVVTVYEKAATHGGLWNVDKTAGSADGNMYEGLWINAPKESNEFWDYTYRDHYGEGVKLPSYMPRQAVLEYMTARVTKNTTDFFDKYFKFQTRVNDVSWDEDEQIFEVHTTDLVTGKNTTTEFDKCIWAAGEFNRPKMPKNIMKVFEDGNFDGRIVHSSDSTSFQVDVKAKRILIIGGAWSAEDLALVAIKVGVERVFISYRSPNAPVTWPETWPENKVELIPHQIPQYVFRGPDGKSCIMFGRVDTITLDLVEDWNKEDMTVICDIDTVVFATGYHTNYDMLDTSVLRGGEDEWDAWLDGDLDEYYGMPHDWKMPQNEFSSAVGDVEPSAEIAELFVTFPYLFLQSIHISNPSLMFIIIPGFSSMALYASDVISWLLVGYLTGEIDIPEPDIMRKKNQDRIIDLMNDPYSRQFLDKNYWKALLDAGLKQDSQEHRAEEYKFFLTMEMKFFAELFDVGKHPVEFGTYEKLGEKPEKLMLIDYYGRDACLEDDPNSSWKTFRDVESYNFTSIYTGVTPAPFKKPWLEIDDLSDVLTLV